MQALQAEPRSRGGKGVGIPNKDGGKRDLLERMQAAVYRLYPDIEDYDPAIALAIVANDPKTPLDLKINCHARLLPYLYPSYKAVEISGNVNVTGEQKMPLIDNMLDAIVVDEAEDSKAK